MPFAQADSVMIAVDCFNEDTEEWEHSHDAGLNEILRKLNPNFRGRPLTPNEVHGSHQPRLVRLMEQCQQLGYSGLKEAFMEWRCTLDDLKDLDTVCKGCAVFHDRGHAADGPSLALSCSCDAPRPQTEQAQTTTAYSTVTTNARAARSARRELGSRQNGTTSARPQPRSRRPATGGWSKEEDRVLRNGTQQGWSSIMIKSRLPYTSSRTESAVRSRKRLLLHRDRDKAAAQTKGKEKMTLAMEDRSERPTQRHAHEITPVEDLAVILPRDSQGQSAGHATQLERARPAADQNLNRENVPNFSHIRSDRGSSKRERNSQGKGRWTKEEDDIVLEALRQGWNATTILSRLPDNAQRTPSGIRSRRIALK